MKCRKCKTEIPDDAQFCYKCGYDVSDPPPKPQVPVKPIIIGGVVILIAILVIIRLV